MRAAFLVRVIFWVFVGFVGGPALVSAQPPDAPGARAAGMAGAFVAVADDATAVYWNPAGLGTGDFFSLVAGHARSAAGRDRDPTRSRDESSGAFVGTPPLGVGYYQIRTSGAGRSAGAPDAWAASRLTTHQVALAVAQSIGEYVNVGAALKVVRGEAAAGILPDQAPSLALEVASHLPTRGATKFDVDLGVMLRVRALGAGLVVRNLGEPSFDAGSGSPRTLDRQVRVGGAFFPMTGLTLSVDVDLTRTEGPDGAWRAVAAGVERRVAPRVVLRGGLRASSSGAARPAAAGGASVALTSLLHVDVHGARGSSDASRGWGVSLRASF